MTDVEEPAPRPVRRLRLRDPAALTATFCGVGLAPVAPGTFGSLVAVPLAWWIFGVGGAGAVAVAAAIVFAIGTWASEVIVRRVAVHDPQLIVIDEVAGQLLVLAAVTRDPMWYAAGFLLFRAFDILKPWPASWADRTVGGGLGVMLDDLIAAGYAIAILLLARGAAGGFAG